MEEPQKSVVWNPLRRHWELIRDLLHRLPISSAVQNFRIRHRWFDGESDHQILTPEKEKKIKRAVDTSAFYSLLDAAAVIVVKFIRWFDPELGEFVDAVFLMARVCKILLT